MGGDAGPKGDTGLQGPRGPQGTISGDVDMRGHRITGLPIPHHNSDVATEKWGTDDFPKKQDVRGGFTMTGPLNVENNEIYGVNDPLTDKSAANKQYVDNKKAFFKDGSTTTEDINFLGRIS